MTKDNRSLLSSADNSTTGDIVHLQHTYTHARAYITYANRTHKRVASARRPVIDSRLARCDSGLRQVSSAV